MEYGDVTQTDTKTEGVERYPRAILIFPGDKEVKWLRHVVDGS
jgi:hypothetical protein